MWNVSMDTIGLLLLLLKTVRSIKQREFSMAKRKKKKYNDPLEEWASFAAREIADEIDRNILADLIIEGKNRSNEKFEQQMEKNKNERH
jgi:hypothetical protein